MLQFLKIHIVLISFMLLTNEEATRGRLKAAQSLDTDLAQPPWTHQRSLPFSIGPLRSLLISFTPRQTGITEIPHVVSYCSMPSPLDTLQKARTSSPCMPHLMQSNHSPFLAALCALQSLGCNEARCSIFLHEEA